MILTLLDIPHNNKFYDFRFEELWYQYKEYAVFKEFVWLLHVRHPDFEVVYTLAVLDCIVVVIVIWLIGECQDLIQSITGQWDTFFARRFWHLPKQISPENLCTHVEYHPGYVGKKELQKKVQIWVSNEQSPEG